MPVTIRPTIRPNGVQVAAPPRMITTQGSALPFEENRRKSGLFLRGVVPAGESIPRPISGDRFFYDVGNGSLFIQTDSQHESEYFPGMGLRFDRAKDPFTTIRIRNPNTHAVYYIIWAGFDDLDDRRTFYPSLQFKQIVSATYDWQADGMLLSIDIPDLSGTTLNYDGLNYFAVNRQLLYVFNQDSANGAIIETPAGRKLAFVLPYGSLQIPLAGELTVNNAAGADLFISELYNCLPVPTS
jgi:hypothetical protein